MTDTVLAIVSIIIVVPTIAYAVGLLLLGKASVDAVEEEEKDENRND